MNPVIHLPMVSGGGTAPKVLFVVGLLVALAIIAQQSKNVTPSQQR